MIEQLEAARPTPQRCDFSRSRFRDFPARAPCFINQDFRAFPLTQCRQPQNRRLGYARVSTYGQTLGAQLD
jgi:hypothetical protein